MPQRESGRFFNMPDNMARQVVGYSWSNLRCASSSIWPKWPKEGFCAPEYKIQKNIESRILGQNSVKRGRGEFGFLGMEL
jgi:hypothetical protein